MKLRHKSEDFKRWCSPSVRLFVRLSVCAAGPPGPRLSQMFPPREIYAGGGGLVVAPHLLRVKVDVHISIVSDCGSLNEWTVKAECYLHSLTSSVLDRCRWIVKVMCWSRSQAAVAVAIMLQ